VNYNDLTWRHFDTAANAGCLSGPTTRRGAAGSRAQGTWVQFDVHIEVYDGMSVVRAVKFLAYGCPHVIAVADWTAERALGSTIDAAAAQGKAALPESVAALRERFGVPVEKLGRLLIVEDAWIAALAPPSIP
jgi:NifU-like protein involved in Fe-S cluster formation